MRKKLIRQIQKEDNGNLKIIFDEINDDSYKKLPTKVLRELLKIKIPEVRYEAIEVITSSKELLSKEEYLYTVLFAFQTISNPSIARVLAFTCIDTRLLNNSYKKFALLIYTISSLINDSEKALRLSNIFCNNKVLSFIDSWFQYILQLCIVSDLESLEKIENYVYESETISFDGICNMLNHKEIVRKLLDN